MGLVNVLFGCQKPINVYIPRYIYVYAVGPQYDRPSRGIFRLAKLVKSTETVSHSGLLARKNSHSGLPIVFLPSAFTYRRKLSRGVVMYVCY